MKKKRTVSMLTAMLLLLTLCLPVTVLAEEYTTPVGVEQSYSFGWEYNATSTYTLHGEVPGMALVQLRGMMVLEGTPTTPGEYFVMLQEVTADAVERTTSFTLIVLAAGSDTPAEGAGSPKITKHPTGEKVVEGESAIFIARADNTRQYIWELRTADGTTVYCADLETTFPGIKATGYDTEKLTLSNIPVELDGSQVRCRFVGAEESVCSDYADITVIAGDAVPEVTKHPTGERVKEGSMCQFVARADNATEYTWMALTEDGHSRYECSVLTDLFPEMRVEGADGECLTLYNIPADMDGWSVYCVFTGPGGDESSDSASLTVTPLPTEPKETEPSTESAETEPPTTEPPTTEPATQPPTTEPPATEAPVPVPTQPVAGGNSGRPASGDMSRAGFLLILVGIIGFTVVAVAGIGAYLYLRLKDRDGDDDEYEYTDEDE